MDKKTKNIVSISVIVVLIISIILTIHFANSSNKNDFINGRGMPSFSNNQKGSMDDKKTGNENIPSGFDKNNRPSNRIPSSDNNIFDMNNLPNRSNGIETKYVVLLTVESFLLGGAVMYLIINNINSDNSKNEKEKTTKKK